MNVFVIKLPNVAYPRVGKAHGYKVMPVGECGEYLMPVGMVLCFYCEYTISGSPVVDSLS
jgi:hypothetical protein